MQVNWIEEYIKEVGPPADFRAFAKNASSQNIWIDGVAVGIIVYTVLSNTISIHAIWVQKAHRNQFKEACKYLASWIQEEGFEGIELIADMNVCHWLERYLKLKPKQKIYITDARSVLEELHGI
jgi:hypothetical protein